MSASPSSARTASIDIGEEIRSFLREHGALAAGIATVDTLDGSPPSTDIGYKLPGARSAISFALPLDQQHIRAYLGKEDRLAHETDLARTNARATELSWEAARILEKEGHTARGTSTNFRYRTEVEGWETELYPDISHRYIAVVSGVASFGWSGNVGVKGAGCAIVMGTTLTSAELVPTPRIPDEESFCDDCRLCTAACPVAMFSKKTEMSVDLGGMTYSYAAREDVLRCHLCCGGYTGLHPSGKWSSWSPGRFDVPEDREELRKVLGDARERYRSWPSRPGGFPLRADVTGPDGEPVKAYTSCGNCALICVGEKRENAKNLKLLRKSGCVVPRPDGTFAVLPAEEAEQAFDELDPETQSLYR